MLITWLASRLVKKELSSSIAESASFTARDVAYVPGEDEEEHKGQQQAVVHLLERRAVGQQQRQEHHRRHGPVVHHAQHREQAEHEQHYAQRKALVVRYLRPLAEVDLNAALRSEGHGQHQQHEARERNRQHRAEELARRHRVARVYKEVLRVAHRRRHAAEVRRDGLERDEGYQPVRPAYRVQNQHSKGHEGDERHVVRHEHGGEKRQQHKYQRDPQQAPAPGEQPLRQNGEEAAALQPSTTAIRQNSRQSTRRST